MLSILSTELILYIVLSSTCKDIIKLMGTCRRVRSIIWKNKQLILGTVVPKSNRPEITVTDYSHMDPGFFTTYSKKDLVNKWGMFRVALELELRYCSLCKDKILDLIIWEDCKGVCSECAFKKF